MKSLLIAGASLLLWLYITVGLLLVIKLCPLLWSVHPLLCLLFIVVVVFEVGRRIKRSRKEAKDAQKRLEERGG